MSNVSRAFPEGSYYRISREIRLVKLNLNRLRPSRSFHPEEAMYPNRTAIWRASLAFAEAVTDMDFERANDVLNEFFEQMPEQLR